METKEHWGLLLPVIFTVAAWLVLRKEYDKSKKWWQLGMALSILLGVLGYLVRLGARGA